MAPFAAANKTCGQSSPLLPGALGSLRGDFAISRHADDLAAFISGKSLGKAHVVGHSRGGAVAIQLALRHPALVGGPVLADPGGLEDLGPSRREPPAAK